MSRFGSPANGRIVTGVWDSWDTTWTKVHEAIRGYGWPAVAGVFPSTFGDPNRLTADQARELGTFYGWDVCVHGNAPGDQYAEMSYADALASMTAARASLLALRVRGTYPTSGGLGQVLAPSGGLSAATWPAATSLFRWVIWDTNGEYKIWPGAGRLDIDWCPVADIYDWDTEVKPKLDEVTGNPRKVIVPSLHRIVAADPVGTQVSEARLAQFVAYCAGLNATMSSVTQLMDYCAKVP